MRIHDAGMSTVQEQAHDADAPNVGVDAHERIRVLLLTNSVAIGGMEKHVEMIARELDRTRAEVFTICPRWDAIEPWAAKLATVADHSMRCTPDRRYGYRLLARDTFRLYRQLRSWRIQVMHMHLTTYDGGVWALLAARLAGVKVVICTEHLAPERPLPPPQRLRRDLVSRALDHIVCVSLKNRQSREAYLYTPPAKTTVVNNGIDTIPYEPTPASEQAALRASLDIPEQAPVIGTVVRLVEEKGLPYLFDALPDVLAEFPDCRLLLVGDGPLRESLEQQASALGVRHSIVFAGYQSDPRPYLSLLNAFVLPVPFGSASIGLLEAMAMRRAVIITFGGDGEPVVDNETGLWSPPRDSKALAQAILHILRNPQLERRLGEQARERIDASFSAQNMADQLLGVYQAELIRAGRSRR